MNAKEYLESQGVFGLDTKKRYNEVIEWMEGYAQERVKNCSIPDVVGRSEQFYCTCSRAKGLDHDEEGMPYCIECQKSVQ
jgi:hypothetical protein